MSTQPRTIDCPGDHSVTVIAEDRSVIIEQAGSAVALPVEQIPALIIALNEAMHTIGFRRIGP